MSILTVNAGSSTIKFGVFEPGSERLIRRASGVVDLRHAPSILRVSDGAPWADIPLDRAGDPAACLESAFLALEARCAATSGGFTAVGHRIVHGGDDFADAIRVDDDVLARLDGLVPLAPLHQPQNLHAVRVLRALRPQLVQVAAFDTAFHRSQDAVLRRYALPRALYDAGVKRFGFHGLSYAYIAQALHRLAPELARGRVIVAHLGSGASLCAMENGVSRDTSMGFSTLDGIPMATRSGTVDAGVLLHLMTAHGYTAETLTDLLYHRSGLLGLSGISADIRDLIGDGTEAAREAIAHFCFRTAREIAGLTTTLGGLDAIVFTAGIGEHQPVVRSGIAGHLGWLGLTLDSDANGQNAQRIEANSSGIAALVIPTDEESVIADATRQCLSQGPAHDHSH